MTNKLKIHEENTLKEFERRYVEKDTTGKDWDRLKSVRKQEPLQFILESLSERDELIIEMLEGEIYEGQNVYLNEAFNKAISLIREGK